MSGTRLGSAGLGTTGAPLTTSTCHRPDIAGHEPNKFTPKNTGIKITKRRARRKTSIRNPKV